MKVNRSGVVAGGGCGGDLVKGEITVGSGSIPGGEQVIKISSLQNQM